MRKTLTNNPFSILNLCFFLTLVIGFNNSFAASNDPEDDPSSQYTKTRYPLVYVPGMYGFKKIVGLEYWHKIPENLSRSGATVFTLDVSGANTPEFRGEQVIEQVEDILAITGAEKVNLLGHSHGAPTIRYVAGVRPDIVASITSISGVNGKLNSADLYENVPKGSTIEAISGWFGNGLGHLINFFSGADDEQDFVASVRSMTSEEMTTFNALYSAGIPTEYCGEGDMIVDGIHYYSWSGNDPTTHFLDPLDYVWIFTSLIDYAYNEQSDGLVPPCASHVGHVIRDDFKMNHMDPMNWFLGLTSSKARPISIHRAHANRLKNAGL